MAESIKDNITATTPSGDPMPKRDPEDGGKKTKIGAIVLTFGAGACSVLELTNPEPGKDAVEAHTKKVQQKSIREERSLWEKIKSLF